MTNGSEHIPENIVTIDGIKYEMVDEKKTDQGISFRLTPLREGARRLSEYEVVQ